MISTVVMTLTFRNGLLTLLLAVMAVLAAGYGAALFLVFGEPEGALLIQAGPPLLVGLAGILWLRGLYRKSNAPPVFFLAVFVFCVGADTLSALQAYFLVTNEPFAFGVALTRTVWGFRIGGLVCLLLGSLFLLDFSYEKYGTLLAVATLSSIALVSGLPLQTTRPDSRGLYPLGDPLGLTVLFALILALTTANYLIAWWNEEKVAATEQINRRKAPLLLVIWLLISVGWGLGLWLNPWWELLMIPAVALLVRRPRDTLF
jgi:hypothetical protein